jgi:hypothetical protein
MVLTLITDCADGNARGRQESRLQALFGQQPSSFIPIPGTLDDAATLEASGNIVDVLDAVGESEAVVLANVAPRSGEEHKWGNGTPFGYFRYKNALVCTTISGSMLALPKKLGLIDAYHVFDMEKTLESMVAGGMIDTAEAVRIAASQFRSFDFLPRVAHWLHGGGAVVTTPLALSELRDAGARVWTIDNFGNAKTTLCNNELPKGATVLETRFGTLPVVRSLKDVPDGTAAVTVGSSGIGQCRFLEIVVQGKRAASVVGLGLVRGVKVG